MAEKIGMQRVDRIIEALEMAEHHVNVTKNLTEAANEIDGALVRVRELAFLLASAPQVSESSDPNGVAMRDKPVETTSLREKIQALRDEVAAQKNRSPCHHPYNKGRYDAARWFVKKLSAALLAAESGETKEHSDILAWLDDEQKKAERWGYGNGGVYRFTLTGPELMRIRRALEVTHWAREWQCRFVAEDKRCCQLPLNHSGAHAFIEAADSRAPEGWKWQHEHEAEVMRRDESLMCEAHPGQEWPHDDCPGPGRSWIIEGRKAVEALCAPEGWQPTRGPLYEIIAEMRSEVEHVTGRPRFVIPAEMVGEWAGDLEKLLPSPPTEQTQETP